MNEARNRDTRPSSKPEDREAGVSKEQAVDGDEAMARERARCQGATGSACSDAPDKLGDDLLRGAEAIAEFLFGDRRQRRKVYHLAETSRLPIFRLGSMLCGRRTALMKWIEEQERRGWRLER